MKPFLGQVAEAFYREYNRDIQNMAFVFPNRRAGIFFKKYLSDIIDGPIFSPTVTTVSDLFIQLSELQPADHIYLLFSLYRHYSDLCPQKESFDEFVPLGETLLNDFDDVDKYMVDARQLFTNIHDLKEIDSRFGSPLTEEQISYIRRFWKNFMPIGESDNKSHFITLWEILYSLYERFRNDLRNNSMGYEGMIFREVAERADTGLILPYQKIVFVGLNVLNRAEESLMKTLKKNGIADFYWDNNAPTLQDEYNRASYFLKPNVKEFPSLLQLEKEQGNYVYPDIELLGVPSAVGQAKQCEIILQELMKSNAIPAPQKALNTAIVLPDEHLLLPMLYAIPSTISPINITMGYTLSNTTVAGLLDILADLQKHTRPNGDETLFYHRSVLSLLSNRYLQLSGQSAINRLTDDIRKHNKIFIPQKELGVTPLLKRIFVPLKNADEVCDYLLDLLAMLQEELNVDTTDNPDENSPEISVIALEREFIYHYYLSINRLKGIMQENRIEMNVVTFFKLLKKLTAGISIPFEGEPLSGLQIMGVLETRALDFENGIILSMNEGVFPVKKVASSLIPYNLRKGFDLSTTEHQDSIYAYYFYRLIHRAKRVFLLYDTRTEDMASGEVSRYVYQMKYHYRLPIEEKMIGYPIMAKKIRDIVVPKDKYVMSQLLRYHKGGDRYLSASAINTYITCPLQFYLSYVEKFQEIDDVSEGVDAGVFGSIYHSVMQQIYDRMTGSPIQAESLKAIEKDDKQITAFIEQAFAENYFKTPQKPKALTGQNYLVGEVIRKYVKKTLEIDRALTPFTYLTSEREIKQSHAIDTDREILLKGFIDRMDMKDGKIRIVDYKTGKDKIDFRNIEELFDKEKKDRRKAIMQVLMYAMMVTDEDHLSNPIAPAIYRVQELFSPQKFRVDIKMGFSSLDDYAQVDQEFRKEFDKCLQEIFNPDMPFVQSAHIGEDGPCSYCAFASICLQSAQ